MFMECRTQSGKKDIKNNFFFSGEGFEKVDYKKLAETAINYSDAVIKGSTELDADLLKLIEDSKLPTLEYADGEYKEQYKPFYETLFEE